MKKKKTIIQFICYSPRIYSGFDKYNVVLADKLVGHGFLPVFVFSDSLEFVPSLKSDLEAVGAKIDFIPASGKKDIFIAIWKLYMKYKPSVVHVHFDEFIKFCTALFSLILGTAHFTSFHSSISLLSASDYKKEKGNLKRILLWIFYQVLIFCSNKIFTVSDAIKYQFLDFSVSHSKKVTKLYLGVDLKKNDKSKPELRTILGLPQDKILLCNISAFEYVKGLDIFCEAIYILKYKYKIQNFQFCHLGGLRVDNEYNQKYRDSIIELAKKLQIEDVVVWMGHRNDIGEIVSAFDIYVHPSRMEGLGVANMEACTQSLPIVGTNVGGIPEIVFDAENGFLFETENALQLAECIYKLILDKSLRERMGSASFYIVRENFSIEKQTDKLIDYYIG